MLAASFKYFIDSVGFALAFVAHVSYLFMVPKTGLISVMLTTCGFNGCCSSCVRGTQVPNLGRTKKKNNESQSKRLQRD